MPKGISEAAFSTQVEDLLKMFGWRWCHFRPALTGAGWRTAMKGHKGIPDYICARDGRLLFAELKDETSQLSPEQAAWNEDLKECVRMITLEPIGIRWREPAKQKLIPSFEVYLWRPSMIDEIAEILK